MGAVMDNIVEENGTLSIGRHSKGDWIVKMKPGLFLDESSIVNHCMSIMHISRSC